VTSRLTPHPWCTKRAGWAVLAVVVLAGVCNAGDTTAPPAQPVPPLAIVEGAVWRDPAGGDFTAREYTGRPTIPGLTSIAPGIALSKTAGVAPCVVMASASPTTAVGCEAYLDLDYWWTCDGPAELLRDPVTGRTVDANRDQCGPEAAFLLRRAGTYKISLVVRGWTGTRYVVGRATASVTVSEWAGETRYFDPAAPAGGNGLTPETAWATEPQLRAWANNSGANRRTLLKAGSTWPTYNLQWATNTGARVGTYGGTGRATVNRIAAVCGRGWAPADCVVEGIDFSGDSEGYQAGGGDAAVPYKAVEDIAFVGCRFRKQQFLFNTFARRVAWWGCEWQRGDIPGQGLIVSTLDWTSLVGCTFDGGYGDVVFDHHVYPTIREHGLFRWVETRGARQLSFAINTNAPLDRDSVWTLISDCRLGGAMNGHDWSNSNNTKNQGAFDLALSQRNLILPDPRIGTQGIGVYAESLKRFAVRDNMIANCRVRGVAIGTDPRALGAVYRCKIQQAVGAPITGPPGLLIESIEVGR
jgi:hypothetical protein